MLRPMWSQWRCDGCGSLLGINRKRRILAVFPFVAVVCFMGFFLSRAGWGDFMVVPFALALWFPYFLLLDRAAVLERCGFRCKGCGYDLQGQTVPRCPECGRDFDAAERAILETGAFPRTTRRSPGRAWAAIGVLVFIFLGTLLALGITHYKRMSSRAARLRVLATQPTGQVPTQGNASRASDVEERSTTAPAGNDEGSSRSSGDSAPD